MVCSWPRMRWTSAVSLASWSASARRRVSRSRRASLRRVRRDFTGLGSCQHLRQQGEAVAQAGALVAGLGEQRFEAGTEADGFVDVGVGAGLVGADADEFFHFSVKTHGFARARDER